MGIKLIAIIEVCFFLLLLYTYFKISVTGRVTTFTKWVLTLSSIGILFLADKIKLLIWLTVVGFIWIIKYYKKKNNDGLA